jgi:hypothetical protein
VKGIVPSWQPKVMARSVALSLVKFIGTKKDLLKLTCSPVESAKDLKRPFKLNKPIALAGRINRVSSAYYIIG